MQKSRIADCVKFQEELKETTVCSAYGLILLLTLSHTHFLFARFYLNIILDQTCCIFILSRIVIFSDIQSRIWHYILVSVSRACDMGITLQHPKSYITHRISCFVISYPHLFIHTALKATLYDLFYKFDVINHNVTSNPLCRTSPKCPSSAEIFLIEGFGIGLVTT